MRRLLLLIVVALVGCTEWDDDTERKRPRVDAATAPSTEQPNPSAAGVVSCYSSGAPRNTCTNPAYCCFNNYTADKNGYCTSTGACEYGTITCDGPEDCGGNKRCCATAIRDPGSLVAQGYRTTCKTTCGGPAFDYELCHATNSNTCATGSCVTAYGNANDLPRSLYVCK